MTNKVNTMGVMNLTPNSFSDGGKLTSSTLVEKKFKELLTWADVIDLGAESTAPFNNPIDVIEEFKRFETLFFPLLQKIKDPKITISIDTYKPELFYELYQVFKFFWPETKLIFNDVSGKLDDELVDLLVTDLDFEYVYSHNLCPDRGETSNHMDFCLKDESIEFIRLIVNYFRNGLEVIKPFDRKIWVDPCFGFSKNRAQNQLLLKHFKTFLLQLAWDIPIVYGISRKSFLRVPKELDAKNPKNQIILDQMQATLIYDLIRDELPNKFLFRVHDYSSVKSSLNLASILS